MSKNILEFVESQDNDTKDILKLKNANCLNLSAVSLIEQRALGYLTLFSVSYSCYHLVLGLKSKEFFKGGKEILHHFLRYF